MDERALKRKRELQGDDEESIDTEGKERPREGLKDAKKTKRRKISDAEVAPDAEARDNSKMESSNSDDRFKAKLQKRKEKRERKKEKAAEQKAKDKEKKKRRKAAHKHAAKEPVEKESAADGVATEPSIQVQESTALETAEEERNNIVPDHFTSRTLPSASNSPLAESTFSEPQPASSKSSPPPDGELADIKLDATPLSKTTTIPTDLSATNSTTPIPVDPSATIDISQANGIATKTNGTSSATNEITTPPPKPDHAALQARLQARIDALRAARKADGPDGTPARSRAELIEARRLKQEARRAHRLEQQARQRAAAASGAGEARPETPLSDEERQRLRAEEQLAALRGTESPLFAPAQTARVGAAGLLFGRVGFGGASPDGDAAAGEGSAADGADDAAGHKALLGDALGLPVHAPRKHKGPVDPKSALKAAAARAARLEGMTEAQREAARRRTAWAAAAARVRGEKALHLDDADPALLRKTVKRRERAKAKGEREWKAREEGVKRAGEARQRKREENLAKRREEKGGKGKGKGAGKKPDGKAKRRKAKERAFGSLK
jgi:hypothetical protein